MRFLSGVVFGIVLLLAAGAAFVGAGLFNTAAIVPPGARNLTGITPGSLTIPQPNARMSLVAFAMSSTSIAK